MNIQSYIKSGYSILYLLTSEESRAELLLLETAKELGRKIKFWSCTEGFITPGSKNSEQVEDPIETLNMIKKDPVHIVVLRDFHAFFANPRIVRMLRDIARDFKQLKKTLVIISPVKKIPPELERDMTIIEFDLPKKEDLLMVFNNLYENNKDRIGKVTEDEVERVVQAAMGLTIIEAENAFSKAIVESVSSKKNGKEIAISKLVMLEKANTVKKSGILEYFDAKQTVDDIGGLDNLKKWLKIREKAFGKKAREYGLPMPRGIMLVGLPGAGKSLVAKAASNILGVPLLKFDVGKVFGGLVGESESNMRLAIQTAEAVGNCVLWIDEMEKAFSGMGSTGTTDGGTSQRVFGSFITWMQEKTSPVFIVATVNNINGLPPELLRKGRFDEIFFVGLPNEKDREDIFKIHINKYGRKVENFKNIKDCVYHSDGFSGAEIEESIVSALYNAFDNNTELTIYHILDAVKITVPLSKSRKNELDSMIKWAEENAVNASIVNKKDARLSGGRQLEV